MTKAQVKKFNSKRIKNPDVDQLTFFDQTEFADDDVENVENYFCKMFLHFLG